MLCEQCKNPILKVKIKSLKAVETRLAEIKIEEKILNEKKNILENDIRGMKNG